MLRMQLNKMQLKQKAFYARMAQKLGYVRVKGKTDLLSSLHHDLPQDVTKDQCSSLGQTTLSLMSWIL